MGQITTYARPDGLPEWIDSQVDMLACQVGIACGAERPTAVGWHLTEDADTGREYVTWTLLVVLQADDQDPPLVACEDCYGWLADVFDHSDVLETAAPTTQAR